MAEKFEKPVGAKKKIENYWYHYKWHTIIGLFFIITILVCTVQCASKEKPDIQVVLYSDDALADMTTSAIEDEIEKYMTDINDDGEIICQIINLSANYEATNNTGISNSQRLMSQVAEGSVFFYITDQSGYDYFADEGLDFFDTKDYFNSFDGHGLKISDTAMQENLKDYLLPDDLSLCIRKIHDTNDTKKNAKTKSQVETIIENISENNVINK